MFETGKGLGGRASKIGAGQDIGAPVPWPAAGTQTQRACPFQKRVKNA